MQPVTPRTYRDLLQQEVSCTHLPVGGYKGVSDSGDGALSIRRKAAGLDYEPKEVAARLHWQMA